MWSATAPCSSGSVCSADAVLPMGELPGRRVESKAFWAHRPERGAVRAVRAHRSSEAPQDLVRRQVCIARSSVVAAGLPGFGATRPLRSTAVAAYGCVVYRDLRVRPETSGLSVLTRNS